MDMVEPSFVPTVFTHNRDRLIIHDAAGEFPRAIVEQARKAKSFKKKDDNDEGPRDDPGNPTVDRCRPPARSVKNAR
jgi:hypothetical protein